MEDSSHEFLASKFVDNWFMDLGNTFRVVVHHLLIGGITGLDYWDEVPIVSALVCMVTIE